MVSTETLRDVAQKIARLHRPAKIDYRKRFGIKPSSAPKAAAPIQKTESQAETSGTSKKYYCFKCKKTITEKAAKFCWDNSKRFGGKAYCFDCQKDFVR